MNPKMMNPKIQNILDTIQNSQTLRSEEKDTLIKYLKDGDEEFWITALKHKRTEQVKNATELLLEEIIAELEQKRKAIEAQNRELEIEAALERVRTAAMGMKEPSDMLDVCRIISEQLEALSVKEIRNVQTAIFNESKGLYLNYEYFRLYDKTLVTEVKYNLQPVVDAFVKQMLKDPNAYFTKSFFGSEIIEWLKYQEKANQFVDPHLSEVDALHYYFYSIGPGALGLSTYNAQLSDEEINVLNRFRNVFELAYRRFIDIEKAIAQAKEAKIEAALERIRSKAMAMNSSEEFVATISAFYHELSSLSHTPRRCGVGLIDKETRISEISTLNTTAKGDSIEVIGRIKLEGHPVLRAIYDNWQLQKEYHPVLKGKEIREYYRLLRPQISIPDYSNDQVQYGYFFYFNEGCVYTWTEKELSADELQIYRRFTSVLSLTYRRYLDLQEAEIRVVEAQRQASLDRVRAEIASMRTAEDLNHITPVIWRELKRLKVPFFRCGVFIVDEQKERVQVYLTTPDGKSLGVLNLPFDVNELTSNTVEHWRKTQIYKEHWTKEKFIKWTRKMMKLGQIQNAETYQGSAVPPESLYLHFVPFTQGMLYVGDVSPLADGKLQLVRTLAEAFSIAYARYEDFKNLEDAKNRIELTLKKLKSAQAQLIHSEKMASLGEVTAGIAHEIKNPLNFVNNFSELSRELIDDIKSEMENKNSEAVIGLLDDLKKNLDKINQHGKRADSIVKGMLLHSRGTSNVKTLTNINDLLDQYVNLAYHGMRAQNKDFNIVIEKDYDITVEKINVVPQDLSRVFLNIINNACYAAYDKKKSSGNDFSAVLKVSTKNTMDKVEVRVCDNGNGIPAGIVDKIFQPFFTTKPTGEGTGLGLSLSYDIITKVHGGEIKFETEEGKYTEFIIILPKY